MSKIFKRKFRQSKDSDDRKSSFWNITAKTNRTKKKKSNRVEIQLKKTE